MDAAGEIQKVASMRLGNSGSIWRRGDDVFSRSSREEDDEEALRWAALEKLPTYDRVRRAIVPLGDGAEAGAGGGKGLVDVDVHRLDPQQRRALLERLVRVADEDNERFLLKLRDRVDRYCIEPTPAPLGSFVMSRAVPAALSPRAGCLTICARARRFTDAGSGSTCPRSRCGSRTSRRRPRCASAAAASPPSSTPSSTRSRKRRTRCTYCPVRSGPCPSSTMSAESSSLAGTGVR